MNAAEAIFISFTPSFMGINSSTAERPATQDATSSAKPKATFRFGQVSAAIFTNPVKLENGKTITVSNVAMRRSYRNAEGTWEHTTSLRASDLLPAALALTECYKFIVDGYAAEDDKE